MNHHKSPYIQKQGCQHGDTDKTNEVKGYHMNENQPDAVKAIGPEKCGVHNGYVVGWKSGKKSLRDKGLLTANLSQPPFDSRHGVSDVEVSQRVDDRGRLASEEALIEKGWFVTNHNWSRIRAGPTTDSCAVGMCHRSRLKSTDTFNPVDNGFSNP